MFFSSCSLQDEQDFPFNHISLNYFEQFTPQGRELVFFMETRESFPCNNFQIKTFVNSSPDHLEISAQEIEVPVFCVTAYGPATRTLILGQPDDTPVRNTVWVAGKQNNFDFHAEADLLWVSPGNLFEGGLSLAREELMRIPEHTVWGYLLVDSLNSAALASSGEKSLPGDLMEAFKEKGVLPLSLDAGDYHYFKVGDEQILFHISQRQYIGFAFRFQENLEGLTEAFRQYVEESEKPGLQIRLFNTKGDRSII